MFYTYCLGLVCVPVGQVTLFWDFPPILCFEWFFGDISALLSLLFWVSPHQYNSAVVSLCLRFILLSVIVVLASFCIEILPFYFIF